MPETLVSFCIVCGVYLLQAELKEHIIKAHPIKGN